MNRIILKKNNDKLIERLVHDCLEKYHRLEQIKAFNETIGDALCFDMRELIGKYVLAN